MKNELLVNPQGKIIDTEDFFNVECVKWEVEQNEHFAGLSTHRLVIYYESNVRLRLLEIEKGYSHEHLYSGWIEAGIFNKLPYYDWQTQKYKQKLIRNKIVELLQTASLDTLQKKDVHSCSLKYLFLNK